MNRYKGKHSAEAQKEKIKKPKKPSRLTRQQKILLAVAIVLLVVVLAVVACQSLFVKPTLPNKGDTSNGDTSAETIDWGDGTRPRSDGERKSDDYYTVLILGRDTGGGGNTDTMLLASYDVTNQKATVMSIPRDTMVNVSWDIKRINSVYNFYGGGDKGIQALYKEISQLVGFEPDYQVVVEWDAVGEIVDAMGGVWFDVPRNMNYKDPYQDLVINQAKGYRLLSGDDAMQVLRWRHNNDGTGYADGDLGRIKTQQAFLTAMVEQLLKLENITKVNQFVQVFQKNVETDLSLQNILWFARSAYMGGLSMDNVNFVTMPNKTTSCWSRTYQNYQSYVTPIASELLELVNSELSPFVEEFTMSDLDIMSVNADGSVRSSTGYVEDSKAAVAPVIPSKAEPETEDPTVDENGNVLDPETGEIIGTLDPTTGETIPIGGGTGETTPDTPSTGETGTTLPDTPSTGEAGTTSPDTPSTGETGTTTPDTPSTGETGTTEPDTPSDGGTITEGGIEWSVIPTEPAEPAA